MPAPVIEEKQGLDWSNWHATAGVGGNVGRWRKPYNAWKDAPPGQPDWAPGLSGLQAIVRDAEAANQRVRAVGSSWSLNNIAYVPDCLVDTSALTSLYIGLGTDYVAPEFKPTSQRFVFAQCGVTIQNLNNELERKGLALPTAGASNGQTIAGAMSTGTHGSANAVGAIPDYILGIHLVAEGGKHYWIERRSRPAMSDAFVSWLGATLIRDDELFLAAVVSFGSFGLIHAVAFQAEPLYCLNLWVKQFDFGDIAGPAATLDVGALQLPKGSALPFHFEIVINPYYLDAGQKGAFVRVLYKEPWVAPGPPLSPSTGASIRSRDLVSIIGLLSDVASAEVPGMLQSQLVSSMSPTAPDSILDTPGDQFGNTDPTGGGTSMEIGVPLDKVGQTLDVILSVTRETIFGAPVSFRYVKGSDALLAFTCHAPITCAIEIPGINSVSARDAHQKIWDRLAARGIPHTYHWGQQAPFTPQSLDGFPAGRVARWLAARRNFLGPLGRRMFSNALVDACGLSA